MKADVLILTNTANGYIKSFTQKAIDSLLASEEPDTFNIIVIESNPQAKEYNNVNVHLVPNEKFNYNRFLNLGYEVCDKSDPDRYLVISNNDVEYYRNWFTILTAAMKQNNLDTASPRSKQYQIGVNPILEIKHRTYPENQVIINDDIIAEFCGWCWCCTHVTAQRLFPLSEDFIFWFQDNDLVQIIRQLGMKHGLVTSARVDHQGQQSYKTIDPKDLWNYTSGLEEVFRNKWKL